MPLPKGTNINTYIVIAGFLAMAVGWGSTWGSATNDIAELTEFMTSAEVELRRIDSLSYRISASERANEVVSQALDDLKEAVSQQSGDIRVMREILQRIERQGQANVLQRFPYSADAE